MTDRTHVVVGGGLAGAKAVETLRSEGFDGRIVLVGAESDRPYERPPLSKGYLAGSEGRDKAYVHQADWYSAHDVELILGVAASRIDRPASTVHLADGTELRYDRLLLATGATPRKLNVPGADGVDIAYLRTFGDSDRLRSVFTDGARVVVIGAGWIGLEAAAAARNAGCEVDVIETAPTPLHLPLGAELGEVFAKLHRDHGVRLHTGTGVAELRSGSYGDEVVTSGGERFAADVVIAGIGARPCTELAEEAGLEVDNGIVVDAALRTGDPAIFAAGDVANAYHPFYGTRIRVEHWANALNGGPAAARSMLGQEVSYERLPYFYTDQYDLGMEYSGHVPQGEQVRVVYRRTGESPMEFIAFWLSPDNRVLAGMNVNVWDVVDAVQAVIRSGKPVDPERLADPGTPIAG